MNKPQAVITVGIPGCGKSHFADTLVAQGFVNVNLDDCRALISGNAGNQACTPDAVKLHTSMIDVAIASAQDVVVSDTNLNIFFRDALIDKFQAAGFFVTVRVFHIAFDVCVVRNMSRARVVPMEAMHRMQLTLGASGYSGSGSLGYLFF
jgi:predicted kinase